MNHSASTPKRVLLGVTGGIAAYKTPELVRLLVKAGYEVQVVMSKGALDFVTPLTLETLSGRPVAYQPYEPSKPMLHIDLARWADIILIAPLSASRLAALAHGFADDLLTTICLASKAPLWLAPAMNKNMWEHPAAQANLKTLQAYGARLIGPESGEQACGDVGLGRMSEPEAILAALEEKRSLSASALSGKTILITAGPTQEPIDPVRYLSNHSSGKMGYALAEKAKAMGARVILVTGPVKIPVPEGITTYKVQTAQEMYQEVMEHLDGVDIFIGAAAVADYKIKEISSRKIKKETGASLHLECVQNPDILASVALQPTHPFCVGFAAETDNLEANALKKMQAKGIDMIALNAIDQEGVGFHVDTNALTVFWPDGHQSLPLAPKAVIAEQLLKLVSEKYDEKKNRS